ncbi:lasso RiPP family leader peptide-containing protein [Rhodococcoides corynebacterioides]|uniref:Lasso RiPP family leader peptide-containing protein n=1 Tax=Rhodococcoides corynebacterioides TaxID=53972 RepID=A0ABS7P1A3_9NOCA|nr:lasso RiPP family leader peptide-containing protein [Rhodococcus corynebacterioides]MBY6350626.1 lasso RiPP family leader peptide-containing protein [Rhodococcus corynebacterioides]MBY6366080.1 lasso RiPP family leader peptide-containing protein [Rhodococcus corynebacterioides]MBY6406962.1 lasso RiPP family leader peptide-containing protein [Rhodococcus corynebacterioides]
MKAKKPYTSPKLRKVGTFRADTGYARRRFPEPLLNISLG